jgi:hypothetical protein
LRRRDGRPGPGEFRIPGGAIVPVLSSVVVLWLLSQMTVREAIGLVSLLLVAVVIYLARSVLNRRKT